MSTPPPAGQPANPPQPYDQQPFGQQQPYPHQPYGSPYGAPGQYSPPTQPVKRRNVLGVIALVTAVLGFIFGCIPGALIVGWVLLPIAFILGIVGLFMSNRTRGTSIAAVIVSIVGTIVSAVVFLTLVGDAFDDAFNTDTEVSISDTGTPDGAVPEPADRGSEVGSRNNPARIGATITSGDWQVVVNSFVPNANQQVQDANSFNDEPDPGTQYAVVNLTVTYRGEESSDANEVSVVYVTDQGNVFTTYDNSAVPPAPSLDGELYNGAAATGNKAIQIPQNAPGLLRLRLGVLGDEVFVATR